jgi:hypothetical protein
MERSVVSEMPLRYSANKLPTSRLTSERDRQRQRTPPRIWRRLIATDGLSLQVKPIWRAPWLRRVGRSRRRALKDARPWRDCDISRLATLLWRCQQQSGLARQVREIYCIYDLAQFWQDLDQRQEQENNGKKSKRLSARRRRRAPTHCTQDVMTWNCLIREVGSRTRKQTPQW